MATKYKNFDKKDWSRYYTVLVPDAVNNEIDLPGSNLRLTCKFCNATFNGTKTRAVSHLIGDSSCSVAKCSLASAESQIWAMADKAKSARKNIAITLLNEACSENSTSPITITQECADTLENPLSCTFKSPTHPPVLEQTSASSKRKHSENIDIENQSNSCASVPEPAKLKPSFHKSHVQKGI